MVTKEEMQAAADAGELAGHRAAQVEQNWQRVIAQLTDRRWIVGKMVEIAVAQNLTPEDFREYCEMTERFLKQPEPAPDK